VMNNVSGHLELDCPHCGRVIGLDMGGHTIETSSRRAGAGSRTVRPGFVSKYKVPEGALRAEVEFDGYDRQSGKFETIDKKTGKPKTRRWSRHFVIDTLTDTWYSTFENQLGRQMEAMVSSGDRYDIWYDVNDKGFHTFHGIISDGRPCVSGDDSKGRDESGGDAGGDVDFEEEEEELPFLGTEGDDQPAGNDKLPF
jgi:hypothetical protein